MRQSSELVFTAQDISTTSTSAAFRVNYGLSFSIQAVFSGGGSPVGVLKVQLSNDSPTTGNPVNWSDLAGATVSVSADGVVHIPKTEICYQFLRFIYTTTSGTGVCTARLNVIGF